MTPDASLTPAGVQHPTPPLTDEDRPRYVIPRDEDGECVHCDGTNVCPEHYPGVRVTDLTEEELTYWEVAGVVHAPENHMRHIADLRARRAAAERNAAAAVELAAEVERLREAVSDLKLNGGA